MSDIDNVDSWVYGSHMYDRKTVYTAGMSVVNALLSLDSEA